VLGDIDTVLKAISAEVNKPFDKRSARRAAAAQAASHFAETALESTDV
jgi:hypothetical protein